MNIKRIIFWIGFVAVLGLIVWGLIAAMNKKDAGPKMGTPAPVTAADNVLGSTTALVTIIEYSDFQCPACQAYSTLLDKVMDSSSSTVRLVYRHFPLPQHANAMISAQAAEAAAIQGKFWDMYELLFDNHTEWTEETNPRDIFIGYAEKLDLDIAKFRSDMESAAVKARVNRDRDDGINVGINYTPTFFLNGKVITNPQSYEEFKAVIEAAASGSKD